jgi:serine/threonine protein kinase
MRRIWGLLLLVFTPAFVKVDAITPWAPYNRSQIGVMDLPTILEPVKLPPHCKSFDHICALEAQRRYSEAFERYEERYEACGDWGWTLEGDSHGNDAAVAFKTTPCGTRVAIKGSRYNRTIAHIQKECLTLQRLDDGSCEGCFPKYYFYSNRSRACYSEVLVGLTNLGSILRSSRLRGNTSHVIDLILQGINIIRVLRAHNVEHRDFTFRNMLTGSWKVDDTVRYQLKVLDFGASAPVRHQESNSVEDTDGFTAIKKRKRGSLPGNRGQTDLYALCCDFLEHFYKDGDQCRLRRMPVPVPYNPHKLHHVLLAVLSDNWGTQTEPSLIDKAEFMMQQVNVF